jgi:hypothetical protein
MSFDNRIVRVGITINNVTTWYENLWIEAKGIKVSSSVSASCDITIIGLSSETRNYILQETLPTNPNSDRILVELQVGRESYGATSYYKGEIFRSRPTQKPNLGVVLRCITGFNNKQKLVSKTAGDLTKLSVIAQGVAADNGLTLEFSTTDKNIRSYAYTGSASGAINNLEQIANVETFVDNGILYVMDRTESVKTSVEFDISNSLGNLILSSGTESGVSIQCLFHPDINIRSVVNLESELNPQLTGKYTLYDVQFDVSSRGQAFYLSLEGRAI